MDEITTSSPAFAKPPVVGSTGAKDWTGNKVSYITTNGFANNRDYDREQNDYYATEPKAVKLLLEIEDFSQLHVWECACGEGHLSKQMQEQGLTVYSSDLISRGYGNTFDFLSEGNKEWKGHIITNPPYKYAQQFIEKALSIIPNGCKVAMFMPVRYTEGKARKKMFQSNPPKVVYISSSRLKCAINGEFDKMKGSATSYAWFVWEKGFNGKTTMEWFN
jgi:hypothetical protein